LNYKILIHLIEKMTPLFAEIQQAHADSPDIFDYIVEAIEIVIIHCASMISRIISLCS